MKVERLNRCVGGLVRVRFLCAVARLVVVVVAIADCFRSQSKGEQRNEKVNREYVELAVELRLHESLPFRFQEVDEDALEQVQMLVFVLQESN